MMKHLYTKEDNTELNSVVEEQTEPAVVEEIISDEDSGDEIYFEPNEEKVSSEFDEVFKSIKERTQREVDEDKFKIYFTDKKSNATLDLDGTNFFPTVQTLLAGKNFIAKYSKQLDNCIFDKNKEVNQDTLMTIIYLVNLVETGDFPIQVKSTKLVKYRANIIKTLNEYFNKNYHVLLNIYFMFRGTAYKYKEKEQK